MDFEPDIILQSSVEDIVNYRTEASVTQPIGSEVLGKAEEVLKQDASKVDPTQDDPPKAVPTQDAPPKEVPVEDLKHNEVPKSTTTFKMPEEIFQAARKAEGGSAESYWSHTLYRGAEVDEVPAKVKVHYCKSKHTTERVLKQYFLNKEILGFDIEWKPQSTRNSSIKKNVSLIQLATEERVALFHVALYQGDKIKDLVPPTLKKIMEDKNIMKVGVAIKADCTRLRKFLSIHSVGLFELSHLYKLVKYSDSNEHKLINKKLISLAVQVQEHLHLPLFKGDVRGSDWSLPNSLQMDQILYSASDSYAAIHLFDTLEIKRKALDPTPPRPYFVEEDKPIRLAQGIEIPTNDEMEPEEPEPLTSPKRTFSPAYLASALESLEVDPDIETAIPPTSTSTSTTPTPKPTPKTPRTPSPLVLSATSYTETYRAHHPKARATASSLRCYFLWHLNPTLTLRDMAALLRETPLQTSTVINYILEAIRMEKLPYRRERLRTVLGELPGEVVRSRYRALAKEVEGAGDGGEVDG